MIRLALCMFKKDVKGYDQAWKVGRKEHYKQVKLKDLPYSAQAFVRKHEESKPAWIDYVQPNCQERLAIANRTNSFVMLINCKSRFFGLTFGYGYTAIDQNRCEPDFGLRVALNTVDPEALRSLQARNIDVTTVSRQLVVNRDASLAVFDIDLFQNLLSRLEGLPKTKALFQRISGADTCHVTVEVPLDRVGDLCDHLEKKTRSRAYRRTDLRVVDVMRPIGDKVTLAKLNEVFAKEITLADSPRVSLALPDLGHYSDIQKYRLRYRRWRSSYFSDLDGPQMVLALEEHGKELSPSGVWIDAVDGNENVVNSFTLERAAVFETTLSGENYVLTLGRWYRVAADYVKHVNDAVKGLSEIAHGLLPDIEETGNEAEGRYNARAAKAKGMALLDKDCIPIPGETKIEVCDLFSDQSQFIHVKRHTRSATLSHLLSQGSVSTRLFHLYPQYRAWFRERLPKKLQAKIKDGKVDNTKFSVVYAITAKPEYSLTEDLPFFSKVNLLFHERQIRMMGYSVFLYHIHEIES